MKYIFFWSIILLNSRIVFSQIMVLEDPVSASVFGAEKYAGISGAPFLYDKWVAGTATVPRGTFKNLELKLDSYSNTLYFNKDDVPNEFNENVTAFTLMPKLSDSSTYEYYRKGISGPGLKIEQYVRFLFEGNLSFFKSEIKLVTDVNQINTGIIKTFNTSVRYYIMKDDLVQIIKLNKKEILEVLKDKEDKIQSYITEKKLSLKKESELIELIKYYNSL
jgi:hypothetical protein